MSEVKNEKAIHLLDTWMSDESGYDESVYPVIAQRLAEEERLTDNMKKIQVTSRLTIDDVGLIANGAYAPLTGFMTYNQYRDVLEDMHLSNGTPWTMPITLAVSSDEIYEQELIDLYADDTFLARMNVTDIYKYDKREEARLVYGTEDENHPGVARLYQQGDVLLGGNLVISSRSSDWYPELSSPSEIKREFKDRGWKTIVGFQTRNPMHRAHEYITKCALELCDGLFIHPLIGELKADDLSAAIRMECYQALIENYYPKERVVWANLPMGMRYAGPREAVHHAIVRKNFGCTHFIVGRDAAGVGNYYEPYAAWDLFKELGDIGITPLFFHDAFYCKKCEQMTTEKTCPHDDKVTLSGTQVRQMIKEDRCLSPYVSRSEVCEVLRGTN